MSLEIDRDLGGFRGTAESASQLQGPLCALPRAGVIEFRARGFHTAIQTPVFRIDSGHLRRTTILPQSHASSTYGPHRIFFSRISARPTLVRSLDEPASSSAPELPALGALNRSPPSYRPQWALCVDYAHLGGRVAAKEGGRSDG